MKIAGAILFFVTTSFIAFSSNATAQVACPDAFVSCVERAAGGNVDAQYQVAFSLIFGAGTKQNQREGFAWLRGSAYGGQLAAFKPLCIAYSKGQVVMVDYIEAYVWCSLAATMSKDETAEHNLKFLEKKLNKDQVDEAKLRAQAVSVAAMRQAAKK